MQNNPQILEWLWGIDPLLAIFLVVSLIALISFLRWFARRIRTAAPTSDPKIVGILAILGAIVGIVGFLFAARDALAGWNDDLPTTILGISFLVFSGLLLGGSAGACLGEILNTSRTALRGAGYGMVGFLFYLVLELYIRMRHGQGRDLWSPEAWQARLLPFVLFTWIAASTTCMLKRHPPVENSNTLHKEPLR